MRIMLTCFCCGAFDPPLEGLALFQQRLETRLREMVVAAQRIREFLPVHFFR